MNQTEFRIGKKYVRGERSGRRFTETITLNSPDKIHGFLWDMTDLFDKKRCNFIVEWYRKK